MTIFAPVPIRTKYRPEFGGNRGNLLSSGYILRYQYLSELTFRSDLESLHN